MTKKLLLAVAALLAGNLVFAGVEAPYHQFTHDEATNTGDYTDYRRADQDQNWWLGAQMITLSVKANTSVWLTNYVKSWYEPIEDLGNVYNMNPYMYGYMDVQHNASGNEPVSPAGDVHYSDGSTTQITYFDDDNPSLKQTTTGYYLGSFAEDREIFLVMRTLEEDGDEEVDSYQYVYEDPGHTDTTLVSRLDGTHDIAGNVRVNFGINSQTHDFIAREFVAVYKDGSHTSGQPLPGILIAGMLSMGTVAAAKRLKKRSK